MENPFVSYLSGLQLGEPQTAQHIVIIPILQSAAGKTAYLTMREAIEQQFLTITEVHTLGSVPELTAVNNSDSLILLLEGEEMMGAKQNRVVNTSILLKKRSKTTIPVSCTERGRWSYKSPVFADSGVVMSRDVRAIKVETVTESLRQGKAYCSDQHAVWQGIGELSSRAGVASPTSSMRDVFEARRKQLDDHLRTFTQVPDQTGVIVLIDGRAVAMEAVSQENAYRVIHSKLVMSYCLDAILRKGKVNGGSVREEAQALMKAISESECQKFPSVGHGHDYRLAGNGLVGAALVYKNEVIHMSVFKKVEQGKGTDKGQGGGGGRDGGEASGSGGLRREPTRFEPPRGFDL